MARGLHNVLVIALAALPLVARSARAQTISLELRPGVTRVQAGTPVQIELFAVSDSGESQPLAGLEALPLWNPETITLLGLTNNGPYAWLSSWFPPDGQLDAMNATWSDGDAFYQAFAPFPPAPSPVATAEGLLVTTWRFQADQPGTTSISFRPSFGDYSHTRVLDAEEPGVFLTGTLRAATVIVVGCGAAADVDQDCDVDLVDYEAYDACLSGPDLVALTACLFRDLDDDNAVDLRDYAKTQRSFTGHVTE